MFTEAERDMVVISDDTIFSHQTMRVNYTTYDMRRSQDSINPRNHADVMVLAPDEDLEPGDSPHPYWYARVCDIFHADVKHVGPGSTQTRFKKMFYSGCDGSAAYLGNHPVLVRHG